MSKPLQALRKRLSPCRLVTLSPCQIVAIAICFFTALPSSAHPVARNQHDRVVVVRLTPDAVIVEYHLELDAWTLVARDLAAVLDEKELANLKSPREFYEAFLRGYAPILADNFQATLDGKPLTPFTCIATKHVVADSIQCDFTYRADWKLAPGRSYQFDFRELNYQLDGGRIELSLGTDSVMEIITKTEPGEYLRKKPLTELQPGDDARLRRITVTLRHGPAEPELLPPPKEDTPAEVARPETLLNLLLDTRRGFWVVMALALWLGAVHALTPGHGKTLVAAYLVGERGTFAHALLLGLVTTLTHTGMVLLVAGGLFIFFPDKPPAGVQTALGFIGGLLIAGLGIWLLLRRLAGQADHVHLPGQGHHHHHGDGTHTHSPLPRQDEKVSIGALVLLGIQGGLVPCTDAIAVLGYAISSHRLWLALPMLLAFSAGLAGVLVAIGMAVVYARGRAAAGWSDSRLFRALPVVSALVVTILGVWLCYDSLHAAPHGP